MHPATNSVVKLLGNITEVLLCCVPHLADFVSVRNQLVNPKDEVFLQAKLSGLARKSASLPAQGSQHAQFCKSLRSTDDIDMSLMVRASRNLPIKLLAKEYERILKRRIQKVGGSQTDTALTLMLNSFDEKALPDNIKQGGSVKKGTLLTFTKQGSGTMTARANGQQLLTVESPKLCQAVFDLYLGDQPVSKESRQAAGDAVMGMIGKIPYHSPADKGLCEQGNTCQVLL